MNSIEQKCLKLTDCTQVRTEISFLVVKWNFNRDYSIYTACVGFEMDPHSFMPNFLSLSLLFLECILEHRGLWRQCIRYECDPAAYTCYTTVSDVAGDGKDPDAPELEREYPAGGSFSNTLYVENRDLWFS